MGDNHPRRLEQFLEHVWREKVHGLDILRLVMALIHLSHDLFIQVGDIIEQAPDELGTAS
jgi:hypothetical protein